jgi:hypothetical protein
MIFNSAMTGTQVIGYSIAMVGFWMYQRAKLGVEMSGGDGGGGSKA